jgi:hypothetical protein
MSPELKKNLERWAVFAIVAAVVTVSLLVGGVSDFKATKAVRDIYKEIEDLPPGSPVLISSDFDPGSEAELEPMLRAILAHCFRKKLRVVVMTICSANSPRLAEEIVTAGAEEAGAVYGTDYAIFGYLAGGSAPLLGLGQDWYALYKTDLKGSPAKDLPVMKGITKLGDFRIALEVSAVNTVDYWILVANARYGVKLGLGTTAVMATDYYQYLPTGQVVGICGGIAGASQYESLARAARIQEARKTGKAGGLASSRMPTQSAIHVAIILLIAAGNVLYFRSRRKGQA